MLAPALGVCAVWLVTFVGVIIGGLVERITGSTALFWEFSFIIPVFYGSPSGAIVAGFGGACGKWTRALYVGFGVHILYFLIVALAYYSHVARYSSAHEGVFWWIFIVGLVGGTAAGGLGGALGHLRAIDQRKNETGKA
jgi:hypothetical protein